MQTRELINARFDHSWVPCHQTCTYVQPCCGLACTRECGTRHTHSCNCIQERSAPTLNQTDLLIDFGEMAREEKPSKKEANSHVVNVNGPSERTKGVSTPESWKAFASGANNSPYFEALHKARQASSMEEPRVVTVDETFVAVKKSSATSWTAPIDVPRESSSVLLGSTDLPAASHVARTDHLLDCLFGGDM